MSNNLPIFLEYDSQEQEQKLVDLFEEKTGRTLYPAQDERLLISIIEYKASLLVNLFNETARLSLTQYSKGAILDYIGEMFDTPRLKGENGSDTLLVALNTTFSYDLTIEKGLEVISKDEKYLFETVEDLVIPAGEMSGTVKIQAKETGSDVNILGIGDINEATKPISYIDYVTNLYGVTGGADVESDEAYIKRILLAPERFTCAGSRQSYIYHTLSANNSIIDATAESVQTPSTINICNSGTDTLYTEEDGQIVTPDFTVDVDYNSGTFEFTVNDNTYTFTMPTDSTVRVYPLVEGGATPQSILDDVEHILNGESVNPMTDRVFAVSPDKIDLTINLNVVVDKNSDLEMVSQKVYEAIDEYLEEKNKKLNIQIIPSQIISKVGAVEGVYSVDTGLLTTQQAKVNEYFDITFNTNITQ